MEVVINEDVDDDIKNIIGKVAVTEEDSKHLWSSILKEVSIASLRKLLPNKGVLFLGDEGVGKTSLACRLNRQPSTHKSHGLEYHFIDINDEELDDKTKLSLYVLDGDAGYVPLLKYAMHKDNFADFMVILVVSIAEPWNIMESLETWVDILDRYIKHIGISDTNLEEHRESLVRHFREYREPELKIGTTPATVTNNLSSASLQSTGNHLHPATAALLGYGTPSKHPDTRDRDSSDSEDTKQNQSAAEIPITKGALTNNLGIPLVVIVTKTDKMHSLEKEHGITDELFDFIQMHLRKFCLSYGAALFYISIKEDKNCELLRNYIQHRIYGFPFTKNAHVIERDCIFVPAGWDSLNKIGILEDNLLKYRAEDEFSRIMPKPETQATSHRELPEVTAIDYQTFLTKCSITADKKTNSSGDLRQSTEITDTNILEQLGVTKTVTHTDRPARFSKSKEIRAKSATRGIGSSSEHVLATFFETLLNRNPKQSTSPLGIRKSGLPPIYEEENHEAAILRNHKNSTLLTSPSDGFLLKSSLTNTEIIRKISKESFDESRVILNKRLSSLEVESKDMSGGSFDFEEKNLSCSLPVDKKN